jgi:hypothetical protein
VQKNQEKEIPTRNLIDLFRNYYKLGIHHFVGNSGNAIMMGLLYKFNEMGFPDELRISNHEICALSALDIRTFRNTRDILNNYLHIDNDPDSWIFKSNENNRREYGTYHFNYVFLLEIYSNNTANLQQTCNKIVTNLQQGSNKKNGDAPFSTPRDQRMSAKNVLPSNTIPEHNKTEVERAHNLSADSDIEKYVPLIKLLNKTLATAWQPQRRIDYELLDETLTYPEEKILIAIKKAMNSKAKLKLPRLLSYIQPILREIKDEPPVPTTAEVVEWEPPPPIEPMRPEFFERMQEIIKKMGPDVDISEELDALGKEFGVGKCKV